VFKVVTVSKVYPENKAANSSVTSMKGYPEDSEPGSSQKPTLKMEVAGFSEIL
jgi:hypothetical protein